MKRNSGRKNFYDTHIEPNLEYIEHWIKEGYSHEQICEMLQISKTTFYKYQEIDKPHFKREFAEIVGVGTSKLGVKLEKALYKEAEGFEYTEIHTSIEKSHLGEKQRIKKITKYARSNAQLLIFALCNKFPKKWKRVDKEIIDAIEEGKIKLDVTDKHIQDAFKALYPAMDEKSVNKLIDETKKYKEIPNDENENKNKNKK